MKDWDALYEECIHCQKCGLAETRTNVVFGEGDRDAEVMFIGEGPGEQEDRTGRPFVGRAGQLLDDMLAMIDLKREKVFIGNMVKCRPPQNRDPLNIEQEACIGYLRNQVALLKPKIIVCLGRIAAMKLIKEDFKITREHGQWLEKAGVWMMAMYHPSALLRDPRKRPESFEDLKKVAEDITSRKDELGFAAFTSAGMDGSSDWRFKTHLANLPVYFEYQEDGISTTDAIKGTYLDNYKAIWDLYINNSTCEPSELSAKTGDDSRNEFLAGEAVFFQNGSWEYGNLTGEGKYTDDDLAMIPIYIGVGDEANQGLCTGTENYWCVNKEASEDDIQATLDFINWCVTSEQGTKAMADDMGFVIPFKTAQESPNLFVKQDAEMTAAGKTPVSWNFTTMPSEEWKNGVGSALTAYAAGTGDWNGVVSAFVDGWASEAALNAA